ncbi:glycosyltransferase family A protein [Streptomyces sp. NEAU-Y11]|uniref:glycosyltransferase family A protein n=1 Tax=Streptomyces cucumeris TaxID=2962890 RepID=UPI0020C8756C|nr:glycosyltransferase family A protein [Streptomyces sp. NEAU-Y11]MCP9209721.1 glycosyltransferase family 2 protein [Streptomyces sp. NEAU-Y11]
MIFIPAWRRPDMLHACLTRLSIVAADASDLTVVVSLDRESDPACRDVTEGFSPQLPSLYLRVMHSHRFRGNSCNVLSGIRECLHLEPDLIHVVEEDVLVARSYLRYHEAMHRAAPSAFAVSACRNQNLPGEAPGAAYLHPSYQSLGVSFRSDIAERITLHDRPQYYARMVSYCRSVFPGSEIPPGHAEQDGLINRVREASRGQTVYAAKPRAFHAGFHGYNRPGTMLSDGTIEERSARILSMTSEEMNTLAGDLKDHQVIDLDQDLPTAPEEEALSAVLRT